MSWDLNNNCPIYMQVLDIIRLKIITGEYKPGDKLPSIRDLAVESSVNPNTIQKAIFILEQSGLIIPQRTVGKFITEDTNMINKAKNEIANKTIIEFIKKFEVLGITKDELIEKIKNVKGDN